LHTRPLERRFARGLHPAISPDEPRLGRGNKRKERTDLYRPPAPKETRYVDSQLSMPSSLQKPRQAGKTAPSVKAALGAQSPR